MPYQILVVDDNDMNLVLLAKILELEGYQVTIAHNGMEAIRLAEQKMPDLAISGRDDAGNERVRIVPENAPTAIQHENADRDADCHEQR